MRWLARGATVIVASCYTSPQAALTGDPINDSATDAILFTYGHSAMVWSHGESSRAGLLINDNSHFSLFDQDQDTGLASPRSALCRLELSKRLGVGDFDIVWKVHHKELEHTVAIKIARQGSMTAEWCRGGFI